MSRSRGKRNETRTGRPSKGGGAASRIPRAVERARVLVIAMLALFPPLYLSNRLPTLHTVTDNKWLLVVFLALCGAVLAAFSWAYGETGRLRLGNSAFRRALLAGTIVLGAAYLASALFSKRPAFAMRSAVAPISLIALAGSIVARPFRAATVQKLLVLIVAAGAVVGGCALLQHAGLDPLAGFVRYRGAERFRTGVYATLGNPEYLGGYLAPICLLAAGLGLAGHGAVRRTLAAAAFLAVAVAAIGTGSRGAFLGLAAATVLFGAGLVVIVFREPAPKKILAIAAIGISLVVALLAVPVAGGGLLASRLRSLADPYSDSIRNRIVFNLIGLEMIAERPVLGMGPGMVAPEFYPTFLRMKRRWGGAAWEMAARDLNGRVAEHVHNDWLEIWIESGLLGFAAWLWLVSVWAVGVIGGVGDGGIERTERLLLLAVFSAAFAILVNALFNFPLHEPCRASLFWLLVAAGASLAFRPGQGGAKEPAGAARARRAQ